MHLHPPPSPNAAVEISQTHRTTSSYAQSPTIVFCLCLSLSRFYLRPNPHATPSSHHLWLSFQSIHCYIQEYFPFWREPYSAQKQALTKTEKQQAVAAEDFEEI